MQEEIDIRKIIQYILLYNVVYCLALAMCYLDSFIPNINYTLQGILICFFTFLAPIVQIIGAFKTFPKVKHSNLRVWFYYAMMGGFLSASYSFVKLIETLNL